MSGNLTIGYVYSVRADGISCPFPCLHSSTKGFGMDKPFLSVSGSLTGRTPLCLSGTVKYDFSILRERGKA
jgi:hypothetical protein